MCVYNKFRWDILATVHDLLERRFSACLTNVHVSLEMAGAVVNTKLYTIIPILTISYEGTIPNYY